MGMINDLFSGDTSKSSQQSNQFGSGLIGGLFSKAPTIGAQTTAKPQPQGNPYLSALGSGLNYLFNPIKQIETNIGVAKQGTKFLGDLIGGVVSDVATGRFPKFVLDSYLEVNRQAGLNDAKFK